MDMLDLTIYLYMYTHIYIYGAQIKNIDVVSYKNRNWRNKLYVEFFVCFLKLSFIFCFLLFKMFQTL